MLLVAEQPAGVKHQRGARGQEEIKRRSTWLKKQNTHTYTFKNNMCNLEPHRKTNRNHTLQVAFQKETQIKDFIQEIVVLGRKCGSGLAF